MNFMKKMAPTAFALFIVIVGGYLTYQAIYNPIIVSFKPTQQPSPTLLPGIFLQKIGGNGRLLWSPTKSIIAGSVSTFPPCADWWCAFGNQQSEIFIVDLETTEKRTIFKTDMSSVSVVGWSSDGKKVLFSPEWGELETGVWAVNIDGQSQPEFVAKYSFPSWSPDGTKLAVVDHVGGPGVWYPVIDVVDLRTKQKERVFTSKIKMSSILSVSWSSDNTYLAFTYGEIGSDVPSNRKPVVYFLQLETREISQVTDHAFEYSNAVFSPRDNLIAFEENNGSIEIRDLLYNCQIKLPLENVSSFGSWSSDGTKLVISTYSEYDYIVDLREFLGFDFQKAGTLCP